MGALKKVSTEFRTKTLHLKISVSRKNYETINKSLGKITDKFLKKRVRVQRRDFQTVNNILKLQKVIDTGIQADKWTRRDNQEETQEHTVISSTTEVGEIRRSISSTGPGTTDWTSGKQPHQSPITHLIIKINPCKSKI